jgi:hypothetical protein
MIPDSLMAYLFQAFKGRGSQGKETRQEYHRPHEPGNPTRVFKGSQGFGPVPGQGCSMVHFNVQLLVNLICQAPGQLLAGKGQGYSLLCPGIQVIQFLTVRTIQPMCPCFRTIRGVPDIPGPEPVIKFVTLHVLGAAV